MKKNVNLPNYITLIKAFEEKYGPCQLRVEKPSETGKKGGYPLIGLDNIEILGCLADRQVTVSSVKNWRKNIYYHHKLKSDPEVIAQLKRVPADVKQIVGQYPNLRILVKKIQKVNKTDSGQFERPEAWGSYSYSLEPLHLPTCVVFTDSRSSNPDVRAKVAKVEYARII